MDGGGKKLSFISPFCIISAMLLSENTVSFISTVKNPCKWLYKIDTKYNTTQEIYFKTYRDFRTKF